MIRCHPTGPQVETPLSASLHRTTSARFSLRPPRHNYPVISERHFLATRLSESPVPARFPTPFPRKTALFVPPVADRSARKKLRSGPAASLPCSAPSFLPAMHFFSKTPAAASAPGCAIRLPKDTPFGP